VESIADKLQRIRAVVSRQDVELAANEQDSEEEDADVAYELPDHAQKDHVTNGELAQAAQTIESAFDADDEIAAQANADVLMEEDDLDAILNRIEANRDATEGEENLFEDNEGEFETQDISDNSAFRNLFDENDAEPEDAPSPVNGRALKVSRSEFNAAIEQGELEDVTVRPGNATSQGQELKHTARENLPNIDSSADEDVSRLMAEAEHRMEEPEGRTRRSAFAHLRAAVAARFADRSIEGDETEKREDEADAYRSDLAEAVKPRRPTATGTARTERPAEARPAPLTLVAAQRIDTDSPIASGPVSPRRVAAADEDFYDDPDSGFKDFAEQVGAKQLPQLLEAAAAYLSFVEGLEEFSRPQLMARVRQAQGGEFSREDGLRIFGMLLRTGKIQKIKGGRFTASEAIGFKPGERAAG
jgi:hypothetical protein